MKYNTSSCAVHQLMPLPVLWSSSKAPLFMSSHPRMLCPMMTQKRAVKDRYSCTVWWWWCSVCLCTHVETSSPPLYLVVHWDIYWMCAESAVSSHCCHGNHFPKETKHFHPKHTHFQSTALCRDESERNESEKNATEFIGWPFIFISLVVATTKNRNRMWREKSCSFLVCCLFNAKINILINFTFFVVVVVSSFNVHNVQWPLRAMGDASPAQFSSFVKYCVCSNKISIRIKLPSHDVYWILFSWSIQMNRSWNGSNRDDTREKSDAASAAELQQINCSRDAKFIILWLRR